MKSERFFTVSEDTTPESLKRRYRSLCKRYHPDRGGSDEIQAQINNEYQKALEQLSEMASRKGDHEKANELLELMKQHLQNMYADMKTPFIQKFVPAQYQGLALEVAKLIEQQISK